MMVVTPIQRIKGLSGHMKGYVLWHLVVEDQVAKFRRIIGKISCFWMRDIKGK